MVRVPSASARRSAGLLLLFLLLSAVTGAGIVYWAWQGSLVGVVLSALLPGTCAALVMPAGLLRSEPGTE